MQIHRFFEPEIASTKVGERFALATPNARIAHNVLRLKKGDRVHLLDGKGHVLAANLNDVGPKRTTVGVVDRIEAPPAWPVLILLQGLPKGDKSAFVVQKGVELGVARLVFFEAERSVPRKRNGGRARWQRVAIEALRQSGNPFLPEILGPLPLKEALEFATGKAALLLDENEKSQKFGGLFRGDMPASLTLAVGPEGGWSDAERNLLRQAGFRSVSLGPYAMRTETAAVAAMAACRAHFG